MTEQNRQLAEIKDDYDEKYGFHVKDSNYSFKSRRGLSREVVAEISEMKEVGS